MVKEETKLHVYCRLLHCLCEDYPSKLLKQMTIKDAGKKYIKNQIHFSLAVWFRKKLLQIKILKIY